MIRKTEMIYKHTRYIWEKKDKSLWEDKISVLIKRKTIWFLFVPIYRQENIIEYIV